MKKLPAEINGFGLFPLKEEGKVAHPDAYGFGYENGYKFESDEEYLEQLQGYADWRGLEETRKEQCTRPWLLDKLK